jgi:hypothetical protein
LASKNNSYFKSLQRLLSPAAGGLHQIVFPADSTLEDKVFKAQLLEDTVKGNLLRTFTMPILKELNNIPVFPLWKS